MNTTAMPGDFTVRGTVVVAQTVETIPDATRGEIVRAVAFMVRDGLTVTRIANEGPTGKASAKWTKIVGENRGASLAECRAAARAMLAK